MAAGRDTLSERPTLDSRGEPRDTAPLAVPARVGRYEILGEIARGGMGVVLRARQPGLGREVALKLLRDGWLASEQDRRSFQLEAASAGSLQHPGIVTIHEAGEQDGLCWYSMELVEGESLEELLDREGRLEPTRAARLLAETADAVEHAHRQGILHRDLKPANVLVQAGDHPKVTDFGIARRLAEGQPAEDGAILGTPAYMPPEQAAGREGQLGPASDVYGLGATLYEALTGRPPFRGSSVAKLVLSVLEDEVVAPSRLAPGVPADLEAICLRCLEKSPEHRYASAAELADDLRRFLEGRPVLAAGGGWATRLRHQIFRRPALAASWLALGVFYANEWLLFAVQEDVDLPFHLRITALVATWGLGAWALQLAVERSERSERVRYAWSCFDVVLLTLVLLVADGPSSPLVMAYPLLVLAAAFRWRLRLVLFVTAACLVSYGALVADAALRRPALRPAADESLVLIVALSCTALMTAALVRRMRGLAGLEGG